METPHVTGRYLFNAHLLANILSEKYAINKTLCNIGAVLSKSTLNKYRCLYTNLNQK